MAELTQRERLLRNFQRNCPEVYSRWLNLKPWFRGMVVCCPTKNLDGSEVAEGDVRGCGSTNVKYDGDVYDCFDCGIFFSDYAANPPHRCRDQDNNDYSEESER